MASPSPPTRATTPWQSCSGGGGPHAIPGDVNRAHVLKERLIAEEIAKGHLRVHRSGGWLSLLTIW